MPSGYEKSPDYGGREYGRLDWIVTLALFVALMAAPIACTLLTRDKPAVTPLAEQAADPR